MIPLTNAAKIIKNSLISDGAMLILLEIKLITGEYVRLVRNTEDITWRGYTWIAFNFTIDTVQEDSKGEIPVVTIKVSNVAKSLEYYLQNGHGGIGSTVKLIVVNSKLLNEDQAMVEEEFEINDAKSDEIWVTFGLGPGYPIYARRPLERVMKNFCQYDYCGIRCGLPESIKTQYPTCNRTITDCRLRGKFQSLF